MGKLRMDKITNPYEASAVMEVPAPDVGVYRRVRLPALILMGMCILQLGLLLAVFVALVNFIAEGRQPLSLGLVIRLLGIWDTMAIVISCVANTFLLFGLWRALQLRSYLLCRIAAAVACLPLLTPLVIFGNPVGIWLLVVLLRPDTEAEFQRLAAADTGRRGDHLVQSL
jgi:hypothetical protein